MSDKTDTADSEADQNKAAIKPNLVDQFIAFNNWPTSQKSALLMGIAFPAQVILSLIASLFARQSGILDVEAIDWLLTIGVVIVGLCMSVSLIAARTDREARWTAYLVVIFVGGWIGVLIYSLGGWSTPMIAWALTTVLLIGLWYDERIGWFAFAYACVLWVVIAVLPLTGGGVYAPAVVVRSIDAQVTWAWVGTIVPPVLGFFTFSFVLCMLAVAARRYQDERLARAMSLIRHYLPSQLADKIVKGEHVVGARPARLKLTIFISDIVGFTKASDELDPEELADVLNVYLSEMGEIAERYGASINQMTGDRILLLFGAPSFTSDQEHASQAIAMALDMQRRLRELRPIWLQHGLRSPLEARMGINTGYVSVGDFGSSGRKVYTAIGMQANVAASIQAECEPGKVLIGESTWTLIRGEYQCVPHGELKLADLHYPLQIYEAVDEARKGLDRAKVTQLNLRK